LKDLTQFCKALEEHEAIQVRAFEDEETKKVIAVFVWKVKDHFEDVIRKVRLEYQTVQFDWRPHITDLFMVEN
jgi:hypothetical protein